MKTPQSLPSENAKFAYLTRFGDTSLVLSQRLAELCGQGPALEEDMALANIALDLLGQARLWLSYAAEIEALGRDEDSLAYHRGDRDFHNFLLVEQPNGNYADTLMRQFYFDVWHLLALTELTHSKDLRIAEIAAKAHKEVAYHLRRSSNLIVRLGGGTPLSHNLIQASANALYPYTGEMFTPDDLDLEMASTGVGFDASMLRDPWRCTVAQVFDSASLTLPSADTWMHRGGKQGLHSEHLGYLLAEMQILPRTHPEAKW